MKQIKIQITLLLFSFALISAFFISCGGDDTPTGTSSAGWPPTFTFNQNQTFIYNNDSIANSVGGQTIIKTPKRSTDVVTLSLLPIAGQTCYQFLGETRDTFSNATTTDLYYVYYSGGRYYQYGIKKLIDTSQAATWDLIGDFNATRNTSYSVGTVTYTVPLPPPYVSVVLSGPLSGKIADSTSITTKSGEVIYCYRIELNANLSGTANGVPISASIFLDYYVGYTAAAYPTNPVGLVELKLRPFAFNANNIPFLYEPGYDRYLQRHIP